MNSICSHVPTSTFPAILHVPYWFFIPSLSSAFDFPRPHHSLASLMRTQVTPNIRRENTPPLLKRREPHSAKAHSIYL